MTRLPSGVWAIAVTVIVIGTSCRSDNTRSVAVTFNTGAPTVTSPASTDHRDSAGVSGPR